MYAWVVRSDQQSTLEKLEADGDVSVHQDPAKADEKGVDIQGQTLELTPHPEGNRLVVTGDGGDRTERTSPSCACKGS